MDPIVPLHAVPIDMAPELEGRHAQAAVGTEDAIPS